MSILSTSGSFQCGYHDPYGTRSLTVAHLGFHCPQSGFQSFPHGCGTWHLRAFHQATIMSVVPEEEGHPYPAGTVLLLSPEGYHTFCAKKTVGEHSWIRFTGDHMAALSKRCGLPTSTPITYPIRKVTDQFWLDIHDALHEKAAPNNALVEALLQVFLLRLAEYAHGAPEQPATPAALLQVKGYIELHFLEPLRLGDLARRTHLSPAHFSTRFRQVFGVSPIDYARRLRIQYATTLLKDASNSIADVAHACGYTNAFVFSKLFKRHIGLSPSHFRKP